LTPLLAVRSLAKSFTVTLTEIVIGGRVIGRGATVAPVRHIVCCGSASSKMADNDIDLYADDIDQDFAQVSDFVT
jgi:hypothetical protein